MGGGDINIDKSRRVALSSSGYPTNEYEVAEKVVSKGSWAQQDHTIVLTKSKPGRTFLRSKNMS